MQCSQQDLASHVDAGLSSAWQPLDSSARSFMESRLGLPLGGVRIHSGPSAARSADALHSLAYTVGQDIVFGAGRYSPGSASGGRLLAHELVHTVQQGESVDSKPQGTDSVVVSSPGDASEMEARTIADSLPIAHEGADASVAPALRLPAVRHGVEQATVQRYIAGEHAQFGETGDIIKKYVADKALSYKVKPGDTLVKIAAKFGISVDELKGANAAKLKKWKAPQGKHAVTEGFAVGEEVIIPPLINEAVRGALKTKELSFVVNGVTLEYGVGIAMGDFFDDPSEMLAFPAPKLQTLADLVRKEKAGTPVSTEDWEKATDGRYLKLAEKNVKHFAPSAPELVAAAGAPSGADHKTEWEKHHKAALAKSQAGMKDEALLVNSFADHFLTDAFAGGHLINKRDVMERFKSRLTTDAKGAFTADSLAFFNAVAHDCFNGAVQTEFSRFETVETHWGTHPNINSEDRFSQLLQGIHQGDPDLLANAVAKAVHDTLNTLPTGVSVENAKGDSWQLSGDGTLNAKSLEIGRRAVAQSQLNVLEIFKSAGALDYPAMYKKVWDYVPRPTAASGVREVKDVIAAGTDPAAAALRNAVSNLVRTNFRLIIAELVRRGVLRRS